MRSIPSPLLLLPALLALLLLALFSAPMQLGVVPLAPNVVWLTTLVMVAAYPPAWPRWWAFLLGLLADVLFATPLGSQALLALLLVPLAAANARRHATQTFPVRWLEISGVLLFVHLLLWVLMHVVMADAAPLRAALFAAFASALWYPAFYFLLTRVAWILPPLK
jgi:rod shape-determining protein MreD